MGHHVGYLMQASPGTPLGFKGDITESCTLRTVRAGRSLNGKRWPLKFYDVAVDLSP